MSPTKPRVTIGVPVYNRERFLPVAIDSLLAQTYADFELIICDNASTDETPDIAREYARKDPRVRYVRNETNIGLPRNFNRVFSLADAEYFKWSSSDDYWAPQMLERAVEILDRHPDVVLCYPKTMLCDQDGNPVEEYEDRLHLMDPDPANRFIQLLSTIGLCHQHQGLIRSDRLRRTALHQDHVASDRNLLAELTLYGKFYEIPDRLYFRRMHPASSSWRRVERGHQHAYYAATRIEMHHWRGYLAYLRAIRRAPLARRAKRRLWLGILRRMVSSRRVLARELTSPFRLLAETSRPARAAPLERGTGPHAGDPGEGA